MEDSKKTIVSIVALEAIGTKKGTKKD